jgi:uncharacterized membrane protein
LRDAAFLLAALPAALAAAPPPGLVCRGHEPSWSLRVESGSAELSRPGVAALTLAGELQEGGGARSPYYVFRGRAGSGSDLVATITSETCRDTMADASEGGGSFAYTARVSLANGELLQGCCTAAAIAAQAAPVPVARAAAAARAEEPLPVGGEIAEIALPGGEVCRHSGKGATTVYGGERVNYDCGSSGGDRLVLVGPLAIGPDGLLTARKAYVPWRSGEQGAPRLTTTAGRVSAVALADGLVCRESDSKPAFDGRKAAFRCGTKDGAIVALLGALEPTTDGFRTVRAVLAEEGGSITVTRSETILVTGPR